MKGLLIMPMSDDFRKRLMTALPQITQSFGTPILVYDEIGINRTLNKLTKAFKRINELCGFMEYYAVKANPNPSVLGLIRAVGQGFDCSSEVELTLASDSPSIFTSNNTSQTEFLTALATPNCIINLDDISLVDMIPMMPELICFRYNPGPLRSELDSVIGKPEMAKYGVADHQIVDAYRQAIAHGAKRFGIHTMVVSNSLDYKAMVDTVKMLLGVIERIQKELGIKFEFLNMGGGLGIPYKPGDVAIPINQMTAEIFELLRAFHNKYGYAPKLFLESGRYVTGPHGVLVTKCITTKDTYRKFRGVDTACCSSIMRPFIYQPGGGYHHISVVTGPNHPPGIETVSVVGPACEDADRFGTDRELPIIRVGDTILVEDVGAHCYAMHDRYNGRLAPGEVMLRTDFIELIRRAETEKDYLATLEFEPKAVSL